MRFSFWPASTQPWVDVLEMARHVESTGWDGFYFCDHFMPNGRNVDVPWAEVFTTLGGIAAAVPRIRFGTLVCGNTYRHPAVLAKMAATLDHMSGGRFVLGLGAGWQENEHVAYGIPFYTLQERLARLEEACQVVKALFGEKRASFKGRFYQLEDAALDPKPVQQPLPLLIGGGGEKVTLRIAARWADEWNVWGDVALLKHKMAILDRHCARAGRDPRAIRRSAVALLQIVDDPQAAEKIRAGATGRPLIVGTIDEVAKTVQAYRDAGVDELIIPDFNLGPREPKLATLDRFIREVAPRGR
jgi:F420-dependent oxidoreductase-like protein